VALAIGVSTVEEIDELNILQASRLAMQRAVMALLPPAEHLLVDARSVPGVEIPQKGIIHGDALSQSIAAASIIAKVYRDDLMAELATEFPGYGFEIHCGYPTPAHLKALKALGPCAIHRQSFAPVREASGEVVEKKRGKRKSAQRGA
jgi:ribonuclease HII